MPWHCCCHYYAIVAEKLKLQILLDNSCWFLVKMFAPLVSLNSRYRHEKRGLVMLDTPRRSYVHTYIFVPSPNNSFQLQFHVTIAADNWQRKVPHVYWICKTSSVPPSASVKQELLHTYYLPFVRLMASICTSIYRVILEGDTSSDFKISGILLFYKLQSKTFRHWKRGKCLRFILEDSTEFWEQQ